MSTKTWIDTDWDCPDCGSVMQVLTDIDQTPSDNEFVFRARASDPIRCPDCGMEVWMEPDPPRAAKPGTGYHAIVEVGLRRTGDPE